MRRQNDGEIALILSPDLLSAICSSLSDVVLLTTNAGIRGKIVLRTFGGTRNLANSGIWSESVNR